MRTLTDLQVSAIRAGLACAHAAVTIEKCDENASSIFLETLNLIRDPSVVCIGEVSDESN